MNKIPIVGIVGKMNTGKDTAADIFKLNGFVHIAFADPLKVVVHELFDIPEEVLWGPSQNRTEEAREILQKLGTNFCRKYRPNIWADKTRNRIRTMMADQLDIYGRIGHHDISGATGIVLSDVRFPNEMEMLRNTFDAYLLHIERPTDDTFNPATRHASETAQDTIPTSWYNASLMNNQTLKYFTDSVEKIVTEVLS